MSNVLECRGLRKTFGDRTVVDDVSFSIAPGETYGLLGPNGAGKSTTISMAVGLLKRDAGTVTVDGKSLDREALGARARLGYVPQDIALYPDLTGRENLSFFGRLHGLGGMRLRKRVQEVLELVGLSDRARDRLGTYSGGMKRRLNIAVGLLNEPALLILDEPTVGVDPQSRTAILESVEELRTEGMAVLYTTHYMEEAERLCNRVGIIDQGRLIAEGTRAELVARIGEHDAVDLAATGDVAAALAAVQGLEGVVSATRTESGLQLVVDHADTRLGPIVERCAISGASIVSIVTSRPNLESVFLRLTGRALRN